MPGTCAVPRCRCALLRSSSSQEQQRAEVPLRQWAVEVDKSGRPLGVGVKTLVPEDVVVVTSSLLLCFALPQEFQGTACHWSGLSCACHCSCTTTSNRLLRPFVLCGHEALQQWRNVEGVCIKESRARFVSSLRISILNGKECLTPHNCEAPRYVKADSAVPAGRTSRRMLNVFGVMAQFGASRSRR